MNEQHSETAVDAREAAGTIRTTSVSNPRRTRI